MATYKFNQFNSEITNPSITVKSVTDISSSKTCNVEIELLSTNIKCGVMLTGFSYAATNTWDDVSILEWVNEELIKYQV